MNQGTRCGFEKGMEIEQSIEIERPESAKLFSRDWSCLSSYFQYSRNEHTNDNNLPDAEL